jgi:hypothetical protein
LIKVRCAVREVSGAKLVAAELEERPLTPTDHPKADVLLSTIS